MVKFLKKNHKNQYENLKTRKKNNISFKFEKIIRGVKIKNRLIISYGLLVLISMRVV